MKLKDPVPRRKLERKKKFRGRAIYPGAHLEKSKSLSVGWGEKDKRTLKSLLSNPKQRE